MIQFIVSVNFRDTDIFATQDGNIIWNSKLGDGGIDWIFALMIDLRINHNLLIGRRSAEYALIGLGSKTDVTRIVRGRDLVTGEPKSLEICSEQVHANIHYIGTVGNLKLIFHWPETSNGIPVSPPRVPDTLKPSLTEHPIILTGEFGALKGLRQALEEAIELPVILSEDASLRPGAGQIGK